MAYEQHVKLRREGRAVNTPLSSAWEEVMFHHDFVTQSITRLTLEIFVDACEWQSSIPQLEDDVGSGEQGWKYARELSHVPRIP